MSKKQTPMQELIELITLKENKEDGYIILKPSIGTCKFQALLDKEKEVIEKAWLNGVDYRDAKGHASTYLEIELGEHLDRLYYNETFGGNK